MTRAGRVALLAALAAVALGGASAAAQREAATPRVELELAFLIDGETLAEPGERRPAPGDLLGLAVVWPEGARRPVRSLAQPEESPAARPGLVPRRVVPADRRAGGRDVVEVLVAAREAARLPSLTLLDARGRAVAQTAPWRARLAPLDDVASEAAPPRGAVPIGLDVGGLVAVASLALLAALGLAFGLRGILDRGPSRSGPASGPAGPPGPDEAALAELDELARAGLLESGALKRFSVRLAEIAKRWSGGSAGVSLLEATTAECARLLRRQGAPEERVAWLTAFLDRLDMVKFAGARPAREELRDAAESLRRAVLDARAEKAAASAPDEEERA